MTTLTQEGTAKPKTDFVAIASQLAPRFAERAAKCDADDTFVAENYAEMKTAKLFSAPVPAELGGGGATYAEHAAIIRTIAYHCGSTALSYSMHSHLLQALIWRHRHNAQPPAEPLLRRIAAEELVLVSSGGSDWLDGSGTLTKNDGGYVFSARKRFGSGGPAGDLLLTTGVYDDPQNGPTVYHFGVNMRGEGVRVLDNWRTLGMRATGSNDIEIQSVFVPEGGISVRRPKGKWHQFFNVISPIVWPLVYAAYLGVAESARDIALAQAAKRKGEAKIQSLLGQMDTELSTARDLFEVMRTFASTDFTPNLENADLAYKRKVVIARSLLRTVELALEIAGGAGFYRALGLERRFRDIQGVRYHPFTQADQSEFAGRIALGLEPV